MNNKDSKKELILQAALKLFSNKGFHATTTKEIAKESGVAEGLIFYYFGDKRKLLMHLVTHFSFASHLQEDGEQPAERSLEDRLVHYGMKYLQFLQQNSNYIMLIWSPEIIQDEAVSREVLKLIQRMGKQGEMLVPQRKMEDASVKSTHQVAVMMLTSSILVYFLTHYRFETSILPLDEKSFIRESVRLLIRGLDR